MIQIVICPTCQPLFHCSTLISSSPPPPLHDCKIQPIVIPSNFFQKCGSRCKGTKYDVIMSSFATVDYCCRCFKVLRRYRLRVAIDVICNGGINGCFILSLVIVITVTVFAIYQIMLGWKTYIVMKPTNPPIPRPTQPKKKQVKSSIWATFFLQ